MATSTFLLCRHVFGVSSSVTDNIAYVDDDTILYVAGNYIQMHDYHISRVTVLIHDMF
jgi:hypothetical protein